MDVPIMKTNNNVGNQSLMENHVEKKYKEPTKFAKYI
jgi:hypothetical protein